MSADDGNVINTPAAMMFLYLELLLLYLNIN